MLINFIKISFLLIFLASCSKTEDLQKNENHSSLSSSSSFKVQFAEEFYLYKKAILLDFFLAAVSGEQSAVEFGDLKKSIYTIERIRFTSTSNQLAWDEKYRSKLIIIPANLISIKQDETFARTI